MRIATAAVIKRHDCLFLARRKPGGTLGGKWELPGGKTEPGESPPAALLRELEEELGVCASVGILLGSVSFENRDKSYQLEAYQITNIEGEIKAAEHDKFQWKAITHLAESDLAASDRKLLEVILASVKTLPDTDAEKFHHINTPLFRNPD